MILREKKTKKIPKIFYNMQKYSLNYAVLNIGKIFQGKNKTNYEKFKWQNRPVMCRNLALTEPGRCSLQTK